MDYVDKKFWYNKNVFLTGHTGFKGSWLSLWLQSMGAKVHGFSLQPSTTPSLFNVANVVQGLSSHYIGDVRNYMQIKDALFTCRPEIVIHMAAQPLVRQSYATPVETYETNIMGTVHVLQAVYELGCIKAMVNVTTDKCYENREWVWGYREDEPMGGYDPYSSSKACSELVTAAYRRSFFSAGNNDGTPLASARAGNVIGGGDWSEDRLVPDILKSFEKSKTVILRNPASTRPWQHVLEPLSGYLLLAQKLYNHGQRFAAGWNFGPQEEGARSVEWIARKASEMWQGDAGWSIDLGGAQPHEASYLKLDISKAIAKLDWRPRWTVLQALHKTVEWHQSYLSGSAAREQCLLQISEYENS